MLRLKDFRLFTHQKIVASTNELVFNQNCFNYIQGGSSAGKSLILNTFAGKYNNYSGEITLFGQELQTFHKQGSVIYIDYDLPVIPKKNFIENVQLPFKKFTEDMRIQMIEYSSMLGMVDIMRNQMEYSSRAEKMLMYLIRVALLNPKLLLIDDIDCFFDEETFKKVYGLFVKCIKNGMMLITSGKATIQNIPSYTLRQGELLKS